MAFTHVVSSGIGTDGSNVSSAVDAGSATHKVLMVAAVVESGDGYPSSATYGGVALTVAGSFSGTNFDIRIYYLINPANGSNTLALGTSGLSDAGVMWSVWSADGAITFDKTAVGANGATTLSLTTAEANELIMGFFADQEDSANSRTAGSGVTERFDGLAGSGAGDFGMWAGSRIGGAAGAHTINYTPDPGDAKGAAMAFKEAATPAPTNPGNFFPFM